MAGPVGRSRWLRWMVSSGIALAALGGLWIVLRPSAVTLESPLELSDVLRSEATGFARALAPRAFAFPSDHGPHPEFRTEWWYVTGNLEDSAGRAYGFQWTVFRNRLSPRPEPRGSAWATDTVYMGHFALTEISGCRFQAFERFSRGALGLAGAQARPVRVWIEDWELAASEAAAPPFRLRARQGEVGLDLSLLPGKPVVLQGENGFSRKGEEPGNASYYYSFTRLPASGVAVFGREERAVKGNVWMDREWSTSALSREQSGWDWFALQLSDETDLMAYVLRRRDGTVDPASSGSLVDSSGGMERLAAGDFDVEPLDRWTSPRTRVSYASGWRLRVPRLELDLRIEPRCRNQELDLAFRYWEGAVSVRGTRAGRAVEGLGYVELTGYEAPLRQE